MKNKTKLVTLWFVLLELLKLNPLNFTKTSLGTTLSTNKKSYFKQNNFISINRYSSNQSCPLTKFNSRSLDVG